MKKIGLLVLTLAVLLSFAACIFTPMPPETEPPPTEHVHYWRYWETVVQPTDVKEGIAERVCGGCSEKETKPLDKLMPSEGLEFALNDDESGYILTDIGTCTDDHIVIPTFYNEKPVTEIGTEAFYYAKDFTTVTIPDGVVHIGDRAFYACYDLRYVYIGSGLVSIGEAAFTNCIGVSDIVLPEGFTSIGDSAFYGCNSLKHISIPDSITHLGTSLFYDCEDLRFNEYDNAYYFGNADNPYLVLFSGKTYEMTECTIHKDTRMIYEGAFAYSADLIEITIPDGVWSVGAGAFSECTGLTSITIPDSVTHIGNSAFYSCRGLTDVTVGSGAVSIGTGVLANCTALTDITVDSGNAVYHSAGNCIIETAAKTLVVGCKASVVPSDGSVTTIGAQAFWYCAVLTEFTVPSGITSIDVYAFQNCTDLTSITIAESVTSIGDKAFERCHALKYITFEGTMEQWKAIKKGPTWDYPTGYYTIYCLDGEIYK